MKQHFSRHIRNTKGVLFIASFLCLFSASCTDETSSSPSCLNEYDLSPLLANYADQVIAPRYADFEKEFSQLYTGGSVFLTSPSVENLQSLRSSFISSYQSWQYVAPFDFGPAEKHFLLSTFNNFPLNEGKAYADAIEKNLNFSSPDDYNKGLPLLDYFLYGIGSTDQAIIDSFTTNPLLAEYTQAVLDDMKDKLTIVLDEWGEYRNTFIANTGTQDGESLSLLINAFNKDYEFIKRNKVGVSSGVLSLGFTNPKEIEAFHSELSTLLIKEAIQSSRYFFKGNTTNADNGEGIEEVLRTLNAKKNGINLADVILEQYLKIEDHLERVNGPLSLAVDDDKEDIIDLYNSMSEQVIYIKSDLPSVLCVPITYVDNPSDSD
jgi:predicted lipoprotein